MQKYAKRNMSALKRIVPPETDLYIFISHLLYES